MPEPEPITMDELLSTHKLCRTCNIYKRFSEFIKRERNTTGFESQCRECICEKQRIRYLNRSKDELKYNARLNKIKLYTAAKRSDPLSNRTNELSAQSEYKINNREKINAQASLNRYIRRGYITRLPCQICGDLKSQGHHEDYSRPLDVIWLCRKHHSEIHRKFNTLRQRLGLPEHDREL